jgi:hypothetical protein
MTTWCVWRGGFQAAVAATEAEAEAMARRKLKNNILA